MVSGGNRPAKVKKEEGIDVAVHVCQKESGALRKAGHSTISKHETGNRTPRILKLG